MGKVLMRVEGINGQVELMPDRVVIQPRWPLELLHLRL